MKKIVRKVISLLTATFMVAAAFSFVPQTGVFEANAANGDPAISIGAGILESTSNTANAQTVYMADKTWKVIGYGESTDEKPQVASSADTMTLISAGNIKDRVQFREDWAATDANHYSKSNLKTEVEAVANTFSDGEKEGIVPRTLQSGTFNIEAPWETDCIAGTAVANALLWPLSTKEAETMNRELRKANPDDPEQNNNVWWLRSPGNLASRVAVVSGVGDVSTLATMCTTLSGCVPLLI